MLHIQALQRPLEDASKSSEVLMDEILYDTQLVPAASATGFRDESDGEILPITNLISPSNTS
jgi:hypothetical protein